tara:strand:+ start:5304 stop:5678 length:375 start_codon:yes stop_codon:yes gene_type:complete
MVAIEKLENKEFLEKSIRHLISSGFENIEAEIEGYESPKSYLRKENDTRITPDIVAFKNGKKFFFEIGLKSQKPRLLKSKWLFLDTMSRMYSHQFRIITTKGHYKFTDSMLEDINLTNKVPIKI